VRRAGYYTDRAGCRPETHMPPRRYATMDDPGIRADGAGSWGMELAMISIAKMMDVAIFTLRYTEM
jgi:hypothetical protein